MDNDYAANLVVVAAPNYAINSPPLLTRIRNTGGTGFKVRMGLTAGSGNVTAPVYWMVVGAGV